MDNAFLLRNALAGLRDGNLDGRILRQSQRFVNLEVHTFASLEGPGSADSVEVTVLCEPRSADFKAVL